MASARNGGEAAELVDGERQGQGQSAIVATSEVRVRTVRESERPARPAQAPAPNEQPVQVPDRPASQQRARREPKPLLRTREFSVRLTKDDEGLGLVVTDTDDQLSVCQVKDTGPSMTWNNSCKSRDYQVLKGDCIVQVNGTRGSYEELIDVMRKEADLCLVLSRSEFISRSISGFDSIGEDTHPAYSVRFTRDGKLGIDVETCHSRFLRILKVFDGPVQDWNGKTAGDSQALPGDLIFEVNDVSGASAMLELLKNCLDIHMRLLRMSSAE